MDCLQRGLSMATKIRFTYVNVTETARELERRHLSGPAAARVLAEALAAVALLSTDLGQSDEAISLQLRVDGPVGGVLVEARGEGKLRGYTHEKILNQFDGEAVIDLAHVMGVEGKMQVTHSNTKAILGSGQVNASPPDFRVALARYGLQSRQIPTAVEIYSDTHEGYLRRSVGIIAEKMPDGDTETFARVLERFVEHDVQKLLPQSHGLEEFRDVFELPDLEVKESTSLQFACQCNREKIAKALQALSVEELQEILDSGEAQIVTCHFCGESYSIETDAVRFLLAQKKTTGLS